MPTVSLRPNATHQKQQPPQPDHHQPESQTQSPSLNNTSYKLDGTKAKDLNITIQLSVKNLSLDIDYSGSSRNSNSNDTKIDYKFMCCIATPITIFIIISPFIINFY
eukprot:285244_1